MYVVVMLRELIHSVRLGITIIILTTYSLSPTTMIPVGPSAFTVSKGRNHDQLFCSYQSGAFPIGRLL